MSEDIAVMVVGYVVWNPRLEKVFNGRVYFTAKDAEFVRGQIIWHNRDGFVVREVLLGDLAAVQS